MKSVGKRDICKSERVKIDSNGKGKTGQSKEKKRHKRRNIKGIRRILIAKETKGNKIKEIKIWMYNGQEKKWIRKKWIHIFGKKEEQKIQENEWL